MKVATGERRLEGRTLFCPGTGTAILQPLWLHHVVLGLWPCMGTHGVPGTAASLRLSLQVDFCQQGMVVDRAQLAQLQHWIVRLLRGHGVDMGTAIMDIMDCGMHLSVGVCPGVHMSQVRLLVITRSSAGLMEITG